MSDCPDDHGAQGRHRSPSPVQASVKITGTVKLHGKRGKVRRLRVTLAPGQTRVVTDRFKR
jgi:hypothetical protein